MRRIYFQSAWKISVPHVMCSLLPVATVWIRCVYISPRYLGPAMWVPVTREHGQQSLGGCWGSKFRQARPWHWWRCLAKVSSLQEWVYESRGRGITCKKVCCWRYPRSFERKGLLNLADVFKHVQAVWFGMPLNKLQLHLTMIMQLAS